MAKSHAIEATQRRRHTGAEPAQVTRAVLRDLFGPPSQRAFVVRLWDGTVERPPGGAAMSFTLVLRNPGALRRMLLPPSELALGEAYLRDDFDVEGDMEAAVALVDGIANRLRPGPSLARLL